MELVKEDAEFQAFLAKNEMQEAVIMTQKTKGN